MRDELDGHTEDYCSLNYEYWCDLMSTIEVTDERKIAAVHINKIASARTASLSDSNESVRIPMKKKARAGVLHCNTSPGRSHNRHHGLQRYCMFC